MNIALANNKETEWLTGECLQTKYNCNKIENTFKGWWIIFTTAITLLILIGFYYYHTNIISGFVTLKNRYLPVYNYITNPAIFLKVEKNQLFSNNKNNIKLITATSNQLVPKHQELAISSEIRKSIPVTSTISSLKQVEERVQQSPLDNLKLTVYKWHAPKRPPRKVRLSLSINREDQKDIELDKHPSLKFSTLPYRKKPSDDLFRSKSFSRSNSLKKHSKQEQSFLYKLRKPFKTLRQNILNMLDNEKVEKDNDFEFIQY